MNDEINNKFDTSNLSQRRLRLRRLTTDAVLIALALVLSIVEHWIPLNLLVPVPGLKLGLANIVTLFALLRLKPLDALVILLVRSLVMGVISGPTTLLFSLGGGLLSLLVMWLLGRWEGYAFSVVGISLAGAAAHNIGQVSVASLVLSEPLLLLTYLPPLLLLSLATGLLTGIAALPVVHAFKPLTVNKKLVSMILPILLTMGLILPSISGCQAADTTTATAYQQYTYEFTGSFDTVIQFVGYNKSQADFDRLTAMAEARFRELNQLFDAYHNYDGINNLKTINDQAGQSPVKVASELMNLISQSIEWNQTISAKTNVALGAAITLWQGYRDRALADPPQIAVPTTAELTAALAHTDISQIQIDSVANTVTLTDPAMQLDFGAVAKGYATELVVQALIAAGAESMIINAGGSNVRLIGHPMDGRANWSVGLQNPLSLLADNPSTVIVPGSVPELAAVVTTRDISIVTSGDYQRFYIADNVAYHHLIDPVDGLPTHYYRAVTVVTADSGLADFLSTALFLLPYEQSRALVEQLPGVEALWIFKDNRQEMTDGLVSLVEKVN